MIFSSFFLGIFSLAVGVIAYVPYFRSILSGHTKPHMFTWLIWSLLSGIAFFAQQKGGAGAGAWATGFEMVACFSVAAVSFFVGEKDITRSDWVSFLTALCAIPLWRITQEPFAAVLLVSVIDTLGFYPTFRKSWMKPGEELLWTYTLSASKYVLALFALDAVNWTTALYPAVVVISNMSFVLLALCRRHALKRPHGGNSE